MQDFGNSPVAKTNSGQNDASIFSVPLSLFIKGLLAARRLIASIVAASVVVACIYIFMKPPLYIASATIGPSAESTTAQGGISSALSAAGLGGAFGGGGAGTFTKYVQLLHSRRLAEMLETKQGVLRHLYVDFWDEKTHSWKPPSGPIASVKAVIKSAIGRQWRPPSADDLSDALSQIVSVSSASSTSMLEISALRNQITTVSVTSKDRDYAIALLGYILKDADAIAREDRLANASNRIQYLNALTKTTTDVYLTSSLSQLLMDQERTLMVLKADQYYAFDMIDPPHANVRPLGTSPITVLMGFFAFAFATAAALVYFILKRRVSNASVTGEDPLAQPFPDPINMAGRLMTRSYRRLFARQHKQAPNSPQAW